jgi:hypothetical protein
MRKFNILALAAALVITLAGVSSAVALFGQSNLASSPPTIFTHHSIHHAGHAPLFMP